MLYWIVRIVLYIPVRLLFPTRAKGFSHLPRRGRAILVCNHQTIYDIFILSIICPRSIYYLAKKELFKSKIFGYLLKKVNAFPVDRSTADLAAIKKSIEVLNHEHLLGIFPEGTTKGDKTTIAIKQGAAMIALRGRADIIPAAFRHKPKFFRPNVLTVGEKLSIERFTTLAPGQAVNELSSELEKIMNALRDSA